MVSKDIKIGFFGTPEYAATTLEHLQKAGFSLKFVVTNPDRPRGRGLAVTAPPAKVWAEKHGVPVLQPETLRGNKELAEKLKSYGCDVFIVIAYGKIIPEEIFDIPPRKTLNIHGSLLPKLRGASPIETAILEDLRETGVTVMRVDGLLDHGPIVAQRKVRVEPWPPSARELGAKIVEEGARLIVEILPDWVAGKILETEQNHAAATLTKKISKEDALLDLKADPYENFRKVQAFSEWPVAYFLAERGGKKIRVKITRASWKDGKLEIEKVVPEGAKEMAYGDFLKGHRL
ncbi:MAG: methionyl-tRNA formyltransferase [Minisyncoccia bacterium]|jgi:methionyl-tRNA formyltransferase